MRYDEEKAIELGKIWMKNSVNLDHNFEHALNTEKHALKIFPHFKDLDENLVKITAWWHDAYKARQKKDTLISLIIEGIKSVEIFEREVGKYISPKRKKQISKAIKIHNLFPLFMLCKKYLLPLSQVLYEADQLEGYNTRRNVQRWKGISNPVVLYIDKGLALFLQNILRLMPNSEYTRSLINRKRK